MIIVKIKGENMLGTQNCVNLNLEFASTVPLYHNILQRSVYVFSLLLDHKLPEGKDSLIHHRVHSWKLLNQY